MCTACFKLPSDSAVLSLTVYSLVLGEAGEKLLKLFPLLQEELIGERQAAEAPTARTAEELLKKYC